MFVGNSVLLHLRRLSRLECRDGIRAALGFSIPAWLFRLRDLTWGPFSTDIWLLAEPPSITGPLRVQLLDPTLTTALVVT
jgi:hypothetical protein